MLAAFRSVLCVLWGIAVLIPLAAGLLVTSIFIRGDRLYWWFAVPFLTLCIQAARLIGGVDYRVQGLDNLPGASAGRRIILCPKHQSTWETFALPVIMPQPLSFVFKRELLKIPFFGWSLGRLDMVHIDRRKRNEAWDKVAKQGAQLMDTGHWLIMFPEGTRTERGATGNYKSGASRLAVQTGAAIVPVAITSARCWPRRSFALRPGVVDVSIGPPIDADGRDAAAMMQAVENWVEAEMRRLDPDAYSPSQATSP